MWLSHNAMGFNTVVFSFQPDMLDIVKSALIGGGGGGGEGTEPSNSSTLTSRGSHDPSTLTGGGAPAPASSLYGDKASLVAAD